MSPDDRITELEEQVSKLVDRLDWVMLEFQSVIFVVESLTEKRYPPGQKRVDSEALRSAYDRVERMLNESFREQGITVESSET